MRADARLRIGPGTVVGRMVEAPPVGWRVAGGTVWQVGTAAGPAGDDRITVTVDVEAGASLRLRSSAATVVYAGTGSRQVTTLRAGAGAAVDWHPEPVVATAGCHHSQVAHLDLAAGARVTWVEEVVLGRHGEGPGCLDLRLDVDVAGRPLLRHQLSVGPGVAGWDGPAVLGGHRTTGLRLEVGPDLSPPAELTGPGWAWLALDGPGWLLVAVADDLPELQRRLR